MLLGYQPRHAVSWTRARDGALVADYGGRRLQVKRRSPRGFWYIGTIDGVVAANAPTEPGCMSKLLRRADERAPG